jgi:mono/diheme cytochrome c family protein
MATYLKSLAQLTTPTDTVHHASSQVLQRGSKIYGRHCATCHGDQGQGALGAYPALAGSRAVTMRSDANLVRVVVSGGFAPATQGNPRPYGMPPFGQDLSHRELADVLAFIRQSWGNQADEVSELAVIHAR